MPTLRAKRFCDVFQRTSSGTCGIFRDRRDEPAVTSNNGVPAGTSGSRIVHTVIVWRKMDRAHCGTSRGLSDNGIKTGYRRDAVIISTIVGLARLYDKRS